MKTKNTTIAVVIIIGLLVIFGLVGYFLGSISTVNNLSERPSANSRIENKTPVSGLTPAAKQSKDYSEIEGQLLTRLKNNPNDPALQAGIGDFYFDMKRYKDAIPYYQKAIELNHGDIDSYNDLGLALYYLGNSRDGLKYVEQGISINPDFQRIWLTKGFILAHGLRNLEEARVAWEKARSIDPENEIAKSAMDFLLSIKDTK